MRTTVDVHNYLLDLGIPHEICTLDESPRTAKQAAAMLGLEPCEVGKCLLVIVDSSPVLTLVPADRRLDLAKVAKVTRAGVAGLAKADETVRLTGYLLGATPPVALETDMKLLVDRSLAHSELQLLYTGGGEPNAILKIRPADLISMDRSEVADISGA